MHTEAFPAAQTPSDSELMEQLGQGDDLALNRLMDRWGPRTIAFLQKITGQRDAAVDLAQETFVRLYQARERYRSGGVFSTYLFTIASNLAKNHARWKSRHPTVSMDAVNEDGSVCAPEIPDPHRSPAETAQDSERFRSVHQAFMALPSDLRESMTLFIYENLSYAQIAAIQGCTPKAVETRIYRARQILREQLKDLHI
jgi:RNA polymerase sigma-70 factor, ECF subfamily